MLIYDPKTGYLRHRDDELAHYGVVGMKWGVRRNLKALREANASGDKAGHNRAVANLTTHRDKSKKKLTSLKSKEIKLKKKVDEANAEGALKTSKLDAKASKYRRRAARRFSPMKDRNLRRAELLKARADSYRAKADKVKAKLEKNRQMQELFNKGIKDIDRELVGRGQDFLYMRPDGIPYT